MPRSPPRTEYIASGSGSEQEPGPGPRGMALRAWPSCYVVGEHEMMSRSKAIAGVIAKRTFDAEPQALKDGNTPGLFLHDLNKDPGYVQVARRLEDRLRYILPSSTSPVV